MATEHSWEFDSSLEGWASASSEEMGGEVYWNSGELRIGITNNYVHFDSPRLEIDTSDRHAICIRYKYIGTSKFGKVVLQSKANKQLPDLGTIDHNLANWDNTTNSNTLQDVRFNLVNDGQWHTTYAHFQYKNKNHTLVRLFDDVLNLVRIYPAVYTKKVDAMGHAMHIDYMRLLSSPAIERVTGCNGEQYSSTYEFEGEECVEPANANSFNSNSLSYTHVHSHAHTHTRKHANTQQINVTRFRV